MTEVHLQFNGKSVNMKEVTNEVEKKAKKIWREKYGLVKDIKSLKVYVVVDQSRAYCVVNDSYKFDFEV